MKGELTRDAELNSVYQHGLDTAHRDKFDLSKWAVVVTIARRPQINAPGWEITEVVDGLWQAVAISTRYRFCGQGHSPRYALEDAVRVMREFQDELKRHLDSL